MTAAGTIGTRAGPVSIPRPFSSHHRMTPSAVASPNAEPPEKTSAETARSLKPGVKSAVSRVLAPPPPTSIAPSISTGGMTTVQPVGTDGSLQCPTRTSGTSVRRPAGMSDRGRCRAGPRGSSR